jgi:tetratricopeptide (TPR) repeat protein
MLLSLLVGLGLVVFATVRTLARQPAVVLLIHPRSSTLDRSQAEALAALVQDHLECLGNLPVASAEEIPPIERLKPFPGRTLILVPVLDRRGDDLVASFHQTWLADFRQAPERHWRIGPVFEGNPATALSRALQTLPLSLSRSEADHLLPVSAGSFWTLIQGQAWHRDDARLSEAQALGARVVADEPNCASAWLLQGDALYRRLLNDPNSQSDFQAEAESHFAKGLALIPHHPRGTFLLAELRIDSGDHRAALEKVQAAVRQYPRVPALYSALAYAARTAGLLDLAQRALERRDTLCPPVFSIYTSENTFLYLGDRPRFEASLEERPGNPRNAIIRFYRGYLALAAGERQDARRQFSASASSPETLGQFRLLAGVYEAIAAGRDGEALAALRQLERTRVGLRVPDGEFTFKMGEAYALLGQRETALDVLSRAFAQGFGCSRWYAESPFLGNLRQMPRWRALAVHVQERQQLFEGRFPPSDFGL